MDNDRFAKIIYETALKISQERKVHPAIMAAQAVLESGYGRSLLTMKANNLFGIKAGKSWKGPKYPIKTREFSAEKGWFVIVADFRLYQDWSECMSDYSNIIEKLSWYKDAADNCKDGVKYLDGILPSAREPGWATDPHYREKILNIVKKYGWKL